METYNYGSLNCMTTALKSTRSIAYILTPVEISNNTIMEWAQLSGSNIVQLYGMDWNRDLTPWSSPGIPKGREAFKAGAQAFLNQLKDETMPMIERALGYADRPERTIMGTSTSGIFALWSWLCDDSFDHAASVSGSLWYPGFTQWFASQNIAKRGKVYLSLRSDATELKNPIFNSVYDETRYLHEILDQSGVENVFHIIDKQERPTIEKRFEHAILWLHDPARQSEVLDNQLTN